MGLGLGLALALDAVRFVRVSAVFEIEYERWSERLVCDMYGKGTARTIIYEQWYAKRTFELSHAVAVRTTHEA